MKVGLLGFGTVGSSVARILCDLRPEGIELSHVFNRGVARKVVDWVPSRVTWTESFDDVLRSDADVIVELVGGLDPAGAWVRRALEAGKSVVTGNKKLIAQSGVELDRLARSKGAHLLYGAAVAGGIPVIPGLLQGLAGDRITRIEGILNGTCNYILSRMETGAAFADVLSDAQQLGYAEADPSEGRRRLRRARQAGYPRPHRFPRRRSMSTPSLCRSITEVDAVDLVYARDLGCTIRQISKAELRATASPPPSARCSSRCAPLSPGRAARKIWSWSPASMAATSSSPDTEPAAIPPPSPSSPTSSRWPTAPAPSICPATPRMSAANSSCATTSALS